MENIPPHILEYMLRKLDENISPEEETILNAFLQSSDEANLHFESLKETWLLSHSTFQKSNFLIDTDQSWEVLRSKLNMSLSADHGATKTISRSWYLIAASVALLMTVGIGYFTLNKSNNSNTYYSIQAGLTPLVYTLPDQSTVTLREGAQLEYQDFNGQETRKVKLTGTAFFEVIKDEGKPFIVETKLNSIKVLGTSFTVESELSSLSEAVTVVTGKVSVAHLKQSNDTVYLLPGNRAISHNSSKMIKVDTVNLENTLSWKNQKLEFNDQPLLDVAHDLENYFKIKILLEDDISSSCRFTGSFDHPKLEEVLSIVALTTDLEYKKLDNNTYRIHGLGCTTEIPKQ